MARARTLRDTAYLQNLALRSIGFDVRRPPLPLLQHPDARLTITFDHLVASLLLRCEDVFFVQIGAYDGKTTDPLYQYVTKHNWRGIAVEPQPHYFAKLEEAYSGQPGLDLRNVAVAERRETRSLYVIDPDVPDLPLWTGGLASFDRSHLENAQVRGPAGEEIVRELPVQCVSIAELLSGVERVDLLQVDVEGFDAEIIRLFPFETHRPSVVQFESLALSRVDHESAVGRLIEHDYKVTVAGVDTIAWHE